MPYEKPNLVLPLAASYNERGTDKYDNLYTSGKDQLKKNSMYEIASNPTAGTRKLYLCKRPAISLSIITNAASSSIPMHALELGDLQSTASTWLFSRTADLGSSGNITASNNTGGPTAIVSGTTSGMVAYADVTEISNSQQAVIQIYSGTPPTDQRIFYAAASDIGTWTEITDGDLDKTIFGKMEFIDGYALALCEGNKIANSDLNSLSAWSAASFIKKQSETDYPAGLARLGRIILAFGRSTVEGFYNAGNATGSPLSRIQALNAKIGLSNKNFGSSYQNHYYARIGQRMFFLGAEGGSALNTNTALYMFDGARYEKVSNDFISGIISTSDVICGVFPVVFSGKNAVAISLSSRQTTPQEWLMFFPEMNEWFQWSSARFSPINNGSYLIGMKGTNAENLGSIRSDQTFRDDGVAGGTYTMTHQFKLPSSGHNIKRMPYVGVIGDTQTSASDLSISFSDDDYQTFSTARTIDLTQAKKQIYRCGSYLGRAVKLEHSANTDCRLEAFIARVD